MAGGVEVAEAIARQGSELSIKVRMGEPELVEEAGHRATRLRGGQDPRVALTAPSDPTAAGPTPPPTGAATPGVPIAGTRRTASRS